MVSHWTSSKSIIEVSLNYRGGSLTRPRKISNLKFNEVSVCSCLWCVIKQPSGSLLAGRWRHLHLQSIQRGWTGGPDVQADGSRWEKHLLYEPCNTLKSQINTLLNDKTHIFSVPPVLEGSLWESLNHTLGSHVALLCEASGVPVPSITWLKDGTPIGKRRRWWNWTSVCLSGLKAWLNKYVCRPESSLQWQWSIRGNRLELGPLTLSHAGTYTCVAKNSEGQTRKDYSLTVQGKEALRKKMGNPTHVKNVSIWYLTVIFVPLSIAYHSRLWTPHGSERARWGGANLGVQSNWNPHAAAQLAERRSRRGGIRQPPHRVGH